MLLRKSIFASAIMAFALSTQSSTVQSLTAQSQTNDKQQQARLAATAKTMHVLGSWQGTTPCADCSGIITTLTLYQKAPNDFTDAVYQLHLKYIDRGNFAHYGSWTVLRGMPGNPDATVYQLDPDKSGKQYYLRVDENTLQQLDGDMKPIDSKLNFTLKRIAQPSLPQTKGK
jgi:copper homeostasis protein (lipoprotein)